MLPGLEDAPSVSSARVNEFSLRLDGNDLGSFTEPELVEWLEGYRALHPDDDKFRRVKIHEMRDQGTVAHARSPWDFVTRPGTR